MGFGAKSATALCVLAFFANGCGLFDSEPGLAPPPEQAGSAGDVGAVAGSSGQGGGAGQAWVSPVAPEVAQHWSWSECGRLTPIEGGERGTFALALSADGKRLASNANKVTVWDVADPFEQSTPVLTTGGGDNLNVALSPDGRFGTVSGDVQYVFDAQTGDVLYSAPLPPSSIFDEVPCLQTEFNFSPDGRYVAGKHYYHAVNVIDAATWQPIGGFVTAGCAEGIAFDAASQSVVAPDGRATLPELVVNPAQTADTVFSEHWTSLTRHPDGSFVFVECGGESCSSAGLVWIGAGGHHPSISVDGNWLALAGSLLHLPSGERRTFDRVATEAIFAPNGDIIAGEQDGSLVRFCRAD